LVDGKGIFPFPFICDNMNRKKLILLVLTVFLTAGIVGAQDQLPINPAPGYYGNVIVNGQQAPPGTTIIAKIAGEERGSITTSVSGSYGDDPGPSKLWVTGYRNEIGSSVTFYMSSVAAQQTANFTEAETINRVESILHNPFRGRTRRN